MFLERNLSKQLIHYLKKYPIVTITGPRQSGKTTLAVKTCPNYKYVTLEDPDVLEHAIEDPRGFLNLYSDKVIFDEIQNAPKLFSYLQGNVDKDNRSGRFILTGSQQFLLNEKISQTLAGRIAKLTLLPLSLAELLQRPSQTLWLKNKLKKVSAPKKSLYEVLINGLYPRIYEKKLDPKQFYREYVDTYLTRDLQQLINVGDLRTFQNFLRLLANRCGQKVNLTSLGNDLGISHTTIKRWLSILEASYVIILLEPYYNNFNKRIVKSPKIYFLDTGLLCYLLRVKKEELPFHSQRGGIFETFVISELYKNYYHHDQSAPLYFWQEHSNREIDVIIDEGEKLYPLEIKSSQTISSAFFDNLNYWLKTSKSSDGGYLVYGGEEWQKRNNINIIPWYGIT